MEGLEDRGGLKIFQLVLGDSTDKAKLVNCKLYFYFL